MPGTFLLLSDFFFFPPMMMVAAPILLLPILCVLAQISVGSAVFSVRLHALYLATYNATQKHRMCHFFDWPPPCTKSYITSTAPAHSLNSGARMSNHPSYPLRQTLLSISRFLSLDATRARRIFGPSQPSFIFLGCGLSVPKKIMVLLQD